MFSRGGMPFAFRDWVAHIMANRKKGKNSVDDVFFVVVLGSL